MTTATDPDPWKAAEAARAELRELDAWLDDLGRALTSYSAQGTSARVMRDWMRAQAARCEGRAFITRQAIGEAPGQLAEAAPVASSCEFCPAGGGGCSMCVVV